MSRFFTNTPNLVKEDTPGNLVLHTSPRRSVTFDAARQTVIILSSHLLFRKKTKIVAFEDIKQLFLDCFEETHIDAADDYVRRTTIRRKWSLLLILKDGQTITIAGVTTDHSPGETDSLTMQSAYWDELAAKICDLTGKTLVRSSLIPGRPHTFVESINEILQHRLKQSQLRDRLVNLRSGKDGAIEIVVDGTMYSDLDEVEDKAVRELIQAAVDEWQGKDE